jgi:ribosomal protein L24
MILKKKINLKKGDLVEIIAGSQKGLISVVKAVFPKKHSVILETGINRFRCRTVQGITKLMLVPTYINISNVKVLKI